MMLKMKKLILLFILTMKSYDYNVIPLYTLLQNFRFLYIFLKLDFYFRDQYNEILMGEYCTEFENALKSDNYTQITVYDEKEYEKIIEDFPVYRRALDNVILIFIQKGGSIRLSPF